MEYNTFHFANYYWFIALMAIPVMALLYYLYYQNNSAHKGLENFADKHLLPHLILKSSSNQISIWRSFILGSILWTLLVAAMADPRWGEKELSSYKDDKSLVILLDLSKSMDANDITPSRLIRERQEIENIINLSKGVKIGLVAFAADAHIMSPITDDMSNIRHLLPLVGTDLVFVQGTRITPALKTAQQMLLSEPGYNNSILIISDGGFQDNDYTLQVSDLAKYGIRIYTIGVGTTAGTMFSDADGNYIKRNGEVFISRLEKSMLESLSAATNGVYFDTNYSNDNAINLMQLLDQQNFSEIDANYNVKFSEERFYLFIFPVILFLLLWFRKGFAIPLILLIFLVPSAALSSGINLDKFFLNKEQLAKKALEENDDVDSAIENFDDPYKKGVAYYKAGKFKEAAKSFCENKRPEVRESALYNLANSLARQNKFEEAIEKYKTILSQNPNHAKSKHNLGVVQAMIFEAQEKEKEENKKKPPKPNENDDGLSGGGGGCDDEDEEDDSDKSSQEDEEKKDDDDKNNGSNDEDDKGDNGDSDIDKGDENDDKGDEDESNKDKGDGDDNKGDKDDQGGDSDDSNSMDNKSNGSDGDMTDEQANQLLDMISNNHKNFLQNQFYIESFKNQTKPTQEPW